MLFRYAGSALDLLEFACVNRPSLIIDCGNIADPHRIIEHADHFHDIYVIEVQMLYMLRDVLREYRSIVGNYKVIVLTPFRHLMHYQDSEENEHIIEHAKELLEDLGRRTTVVSAMDVGVQVEDVWDIPSVAKDASSSG